MPEITDKEALRVMAEAVDYLIETLWNNEMNGNAPSWFTEEMVLNDRLPVGSERRAAYEHAKFAALDAAKKGEQHG